MLTVQAISGHSGEANVTCLDMLLSTGTFIQMPSLTFKGFGNFCLVGNKFVNERLLEDIPVVTGAEKLSRKLKKIVRLIQ